MVAPHLPRRCGAGAVERILTYYLVTLVLAVAVSLPGLGSGGSVLPTVAVLLMVVPRALAGTLIVIDTAAWAPAASVARSHVTIPVPLSVQLELEVSLAKVVSFGSGSLTVTPLASDGPLFRTVML